MAYRFEFSGGVCKPHVHQLEKFLLFFVVGGREVPLYQMVQEGVVARLSRDTAEYQTSNNILKVFVMQSGFGIPKRYHSFYFRLMPEPHALVTIKSFPAVGRKTTCSEFYFKGMGRFLNREQVLQLLSDANGDKRSLSFVKNQSPLPVDMLRAMVTVDRSTLKCGVRRVRIGSNGTS